MKILICNAGSTSLKFKLWQMPQERELAQGRVERIGMGGAIFAYACPEAGAELTLTGLDVKGYTQGISMFLQRLTGKDGAINSLEQLDAVGFKTVLSKGFSGVHLLTEEVLAGMRATMTVAPAHNGPYLEAIGVFQKLAPRVPLVGVFETAFHRTIPDYRRLYALPWDWIERYQIHKMGFHGASHSYVALRTGGRGRVISCHLGGSSSLCALLNGRSVDNSFGLSLQNGIPHNNRVGDLDPYVILYLLDQGLSAAEIDRGLTKEAGLKGISGLSGDMRDIEKAMEAGNQRARLAFEMFTDAVKRYVGAYTVELGGLDQLAFTGGIGENSWRVRERVCQGLLCLGVEMDEGLNRGLQGEGVISKAHSRVMVRVIAANEELMVVRAACDCLENQREGDRSDAHPPEL